MPEEKPDFQIKEYSVLIRATVLENEVENSTDLKLVISVKQGIKRRLLLEILSYALETVNDV